MFKQTLAVCVCKYAYVCVCVYVYVYAYVYAYVYKYQPMDIHSPLFIFFVVALYARLSYTRRSDSITKSNNHE